MEYSSKGAKIKGINNHNEINTYTWSLGYLQLPIYAGYKIDLGKTKMNIKVGPYFAYALFGKLSQGDYSVNLFGSSTDTEFRRFDAGIGCIIGFEFEKFELFWGSEGGLNNLVKRSYQMPRGYAIRNINSLFGLRYKL